MKVTLVAHTVHHIFSLPSLTIRGQYSLALIVFLACSFLNRHYRAPWTAIALGFWSLCDLGGLLLVFNSPVFLFFYLFLLLPVLLLFLFLGFHNGAL